MSQDKLLRKGSQKPLHLKVAYEAKGEVGWLIIDSRFWPILSPGNRQLLAFSGLQAIRHQLFRGGPKIWRRFKPR